MKLKQTIPKLLTVSLATILLTGCAATSEPKTSLIDNYYKEKSLLTKEQQAKKGLFKTMEHYLIEQKDKELELLKYREGDNMVAYINKLVSDKAPNTVLLIDPKYNHLTFEKNSPTVFSGLAEFIVYSNMTSGLKYNLSVEANGRFKKLIFTSRDTLTDKLKKTKVEFSNNIGVLEALNLTAKQLNVTLDMDRWSKDLLSVQTPEVINTNAYTFLNNVATTNNLFLTITKDTVKLSQLKSKVYDIFITPLTISADSSNSLDSGDSSTAKSKGTQDSALSFGYRIYDELEKNVKAIVGKRGMFFLNQASGQLTVRTQKDNLALVDTIVEKFNNMYSKQIEMRMQIIEITLNEEHQNGLDIGISKFNSSGTMAGRFETATTGTVTPNLSGRIENISGGILSDTFDLSSGSSNMVKKAFDIKMLNTYGDVSVVSKPVLKTLNSIPAVLDVGLETEYISEIKTTTDTNGARESTLTVGIAKDGIKIYMYPRIVRDNQILLTITPQITAVMDLVDVGAADNGMKTKTINNRTFNSTLVFNNGETIMFAGLLSKYTKGDKSGMPWTEKEDSITDFVGGTRASLKKKTELVLVITTKIINQ